jgi:hypothetical protein
LVASTLAGVVILIGLGMWSGEPANWWSVALTVVVLRLYWVYVSPRIRARVAAKDAEQRAAERRAYEQEMRERQEYWRQQSGR